MAEEKIAEIYIDISGRTERLERELKKLQGDTDKSSKKMAGSFQKNWIAGIAKVTTAFYGLRKAISFAIASKNAARDAEEINNKFLTVFENVRGSSSRTSKALAKDFDLADSTAQEMLSTTGDLLVGFGFTEQKALDLSDQVSRLAIDLASFSNYAGGAKGANEALTKAILGETEMAKSLGIVIRQNTKEFNAQIKELMQTKGLTEQQAKAELILKQAYEQSKKAVGDYARTSDSLANTERRLQETQKELSETVGKLTIPAMIRYNEVMISLAKNTKDYLDVLDQGFIMKMLKSAEAWEIAGKSMIKALIEGKPLAIAQAEVMADNIEKVEKFNKQFEKTIDLVDELKQTTQTLETPQSIIADVETKVEKPIIDWAAAMEQATQGPQRQTLEEALSGQTGVGLEDLIAGPGSDLMDQIPEEFADGFDSAYSQISQGFAGLMQTMLRGGKLTADQLVSAFASILNVVPGGKVVGGILNALGFEKGGFLSRQGNNFSGVPKLADGGTFKVPVGFNNDTFPLPAAFLSSGETLRVTPTAKVGQEAKAIDDLAKSIRAMNINMVSMERKVNISGKLESQIKGNDIYMVNDERTRQRSRF